MSTLSKVFARMRASSFRLIALGLVALVFLLALPHAAPVSASTIAPQHPTIVAPQVLEILSFDVKAKKNKVDVKWVTVNELTIVGFHVWRRTAKSSYVRLDDSLIAAQSTGELAGNAYQIKDSSIRKDKTYYYDLEVVNADGTSSFTDEVKVKTK